MSETVMVERSEQLEEGLIEARLLTEVDHLIQNRLPDGSFDEEALRDIAINLEAGVQEISIPYAVTTTIQRAAEEVVDGRRYRVFRWLGRSAIDVARSGRQYYFSEAAFRRQDIEEAEAAHNQEALRPGKTQVFISPRMTKYDAPEDIAKAEHLHADDAVRIATAITDRNGTVIACRRMSLLVRDIPLDAWQAMLQDPNNIFGRAFSIRDKRSALSVMELFNELELPDEALPEGPVTILSAVLPYIQDPQACQSLSQQIGRFREEQQTYREVAEKRAAEWMQFEIELANSLDSGWATPEIVNFMQALDHEWNDRVRNLIDNHDMGEGRYIMTRQLAARLEKAKQNILGSMAAIETGNEKVIEQMDELSVRRIRKQIQRYDAALANGASQYDLRMLDMELSQDIARQRLVVGGGCPGDNDGEFGSESDAAGGNSSSSQSEGSGRNAKTLENAGVNAGECWIKTTGCYCCMLNSDGTPRRTAMTVNAVIKSNKTIYCMRGGCGAWLAEGGKSRYKGSIAGRAAVLAKRGVAAPQPEDKEETADEPSTKEDEQHELQEVA